MEKGFCSVGRLVVGILLMAFSLFILFQSCATGVVNTLDESGDSGGSAGFFVAVLMIASGIVAIVTRNSSSKVGSVIILVMLVIAALLALCNAAVYKDLIIWGIADLIAAAFFLLCAIKTRRDSNEK